MSKSATWRLSVPCCSPSYPSMRCITWMQIYIYVERVQRASAQFEILNCRLGLHALFVCPLNPFLSHSAKQRILGNLGSSMQLLVSLFQTCSSRMLVFKEFIRLAHWLKITFNFKLKLEMIISSLIKLSNIAEKIKTTDLYPFHIAKFAVTPHWTPLSIHPLCCCYTPVRFGLLSHWASDLRILESAV